jgi:hypothetical protein
MTDTEIMEGHTPTEKEVHEVIRILKERPFGAIMKSAMEGNPDDCLETGMR